MYQEDDLLPLSALQHLAFCPRQCALIHVEQLWHENRQTAEGRVMHDRVHREGSEQRGTVRIEYAVRLRSLLLGLSGVADVVEFHRSGSEIVPYPVEQKRGRPKPDNCDKVQLCAQAMALEEMLHLTVPEGAIFYGKRRRREIVVFDRELRLETESLAGELHGLIASGKTPGAKYSPKCDLCSLIDLCMPRVLPSSDAVDYLKKLRDME